MREDERRRPPLRTWVAASAATVLMTAAFFLLPVGGFGPHRPVLSWTCFGLGLAVVAILLLVQVRAVLWESTRSGPGLVIAVLMVLTVLVFATAYLALSKDPGEMDGLTTRVDALYFTLATTATVGYGDIVARGQGARTVVIAHIVYTVVFLSAAAAAFSQQIHRSVHRRHAQTGHGADPGHGSDPGHRPDVDH